MPGFLKDPPSAASCSSTDLAPVLFEKLKETYLKNSIPLITTGVMTHVLGFAIVGVEFGAMEALIWGSLMRLLVFLLILVADHKKDESKSCVAVCLG